MRLHIKKSPDSNEYELWNGTRLIAKGNIHKANRLMGKELDKVKR
jgi:hypothetical protein